MTRLTGVQSGLIFKWVHELLMHVVLKETTRTVKVVSVLAYSIYASVVQCVARQREPV